MHTIREKTKLIARVRRIRGQIEAVERALASETECTDVLRLIASVRGAVNGLDGRSDGRPRSGAYSRRGQRRRADQERRGVYRNREGLFEIRGAENHGPTTQQRFHTSGTIRRAHNRPRRVSPASRTTATIMTSHEDGHDHSHGFDTLEAARIASRRAIRGRSGVVQFGNRSAR